MDSSEAYTRLGKCKCSRKEGQERYILISLDCCHGWERQCMLCGRRQEVHEEHKHSKGEDN